MNYMKTLNSDVSEVCDTACIRGFEIVHYTYLGGTRYRDTVVQYGSSPVRDKKSMDAYIQELVETGVDFTVHPIM